VVAATAGDGRAAVGAGPGSGAGPEGQGTGRRAARDEASPSRGMGAFGSGSRPSLDEVVRQNLSLFRSDGNVGLVKLALSQLERTAIRRLTRTYLRLDLADIATRTGLESAGAAEATILDMCASRGIFARVDRSTGTVGFDAPMPTFDDPAALAALQGRIKAASELADRVGDAETRVAVSRGFLASRHGKAAIGGGGDPRGRSRGGGGGGGGGPSAAGGGAGDAGMAEALARSLAEQ